jgi:hypothetical protein
MVDRDGNVWLLEYDTNDTAERTGAVARSAADLTPTTRRS